MQVDTKRIRRIMIILCIPIVIIVSLVSTCYNAYDQNQFEFEYIKFYVDDEINIATVMEGLRPFISVSYSVSNLSSKSHVYKYSCKVFKTSSQLEVCNGTSISWEIDSEQTNTISCILYPSNSWLAAGNNNILNSDLVDCSIKLTAIYIDGKLVAEE